MTVSGEGRDIAAHRTGLARLQIIPAQLQLGIGLFKDAIDTALLALLHRPAEILLRFAWAAQLERHGVQ